MAVLAAGPMTARSTRPKPSTARLAEGGGQAFALPVEQAALQRVALRRQREQPLPPVLPAGRLRHVAVRHQLVQHPRQALLGDAQDAEQLAHRHARVAADEVQRAVVGAAQAQLVQDRVGRRGEVAVGEEHHVLRLADLLLPQEQQGRASLRGRPFGLQSGHGWRSLQLRQSS